MRGPYCSDKERTLRMGPVLWQLLRGRPLDAHPSPALAQNGANIYHYPGWAMMACIIIGAKQEL